MKKYFIIFLSSFFLSAFFGPFLIDASASPSSRRIVEKTKKKADKKPPLILARGWNWKMDVSGWWMSEKLDGVRGYWTGEKLIARSGKPFIVPAWFVKNFPPFPLDGELWMGRGRFSEISGVARRKKPDARWKEVGYFIFDAPQAEGSFEKRLETVRKWFKEHPGSSARLIKQEICRNNKHLLKKLSEVESKGGEGLILRRPGSPYTTGRTKDFLKVKRFKEDEAKVIKHIPGKGKHKGRLGALLTELKDGRRLSIGTGFSNKDRENPPPVGSVVVFRHQGFTKSGIPRFASFLRVKKAKKNPGKKPSK